MKITITINTENAAFHEPDDDPGSEIARILRRLSLKPWPVANHTPIRDSNGNKVGVITIEQDKTEEIASHAS